MNKLINIKNVDNWEEFVRWCKHNDTSLRKEIEGFIAKKLNKEE